jgi:hypothetical protein
MLCRQIFVDLACLLSARCELESLTACHQSRWGEESTDQCHLYVFLVGWAMTDFKASQCCAESGPEDIVS